METSSVKKEENVYERKTTLCHQLCYFLKEALRALLKCLGVETATEKKEKTSHLKPHSDADLDTTPETSATNTKKSYQEAANPPITTTQNIINNASLVARSGPPDLSQGSGPQHNH